jgi:outer membrane protein assembly factor BamB
MAVDAYNGRPLWEFEIKGILKAYDGEHLAGTAITGSNICVWRDSVYLRHRHRCYRIDVETGNTVATFQTPTQPGEARPTWGYIACENGVLWGSIANQGHVVRHAYGRADRQMERQFSESSALFALDVDTGQRLWRYDAQQSIRHNAIAIGGGRVFLIDRALAEDDLLSRALARREQPAPPSGHPTGALIALDAITGQRIWQTDKDVYGTTLAYSQPFHRLLMCYQTTRFRLPSELGGRMAVYSAIDGVRLWDRKAKYETRPLINGRTIFAYPTRLDLLTGESAPLDFDKSYGCGQLSGSQHLLLFRSATFGYYDLTKKVGVENFGGIRPGCWINALPVGGVVLLPDASAGCRCSYQNRSWAAFQGS